MNLLEQLKPADRCVVMGVVNVTPDSFSDGGLHNSTEAAIARGVALARLGADIIDVGGESTRPGAQRVNVETELARVVPVVSGLAEQGVATSIDTTRASVAESAVRAGALLVNDISGGRLDPEMFAAVAQLQVPIVVMHWRAPSERMDEFTSYRDVVAEVTADLAERVNAAAAAGIEPADIVVDPGLGFAKEAHHNWELLARLADLTDLGQPILIGASRKRFIGAALADEAGEPRPVEQRDAGTDAISALAAAAGVWGVRVHDVAGTLDAVRVGTAWRRGGRR